jgi:hypothetical protein
MQNKRMFIILGVLVVLVGVAAFLAGRMLNGKVGPLGFGMPIGNGGMVSISVQVTPAPELPKTEPETRGLFVERKDNSIFVSAISMDAGGKGVVLQADGGKGGDGEPSVSGPKPDGPKKEVVITNETTIYLENTDLGQPKPGENKVIQQTVTEASLDDLTSQSFVTVWGRKSGDRIIAEVLFISNPVMFKRPAP